MGVSGFDPNVIRKGWPHSICGTCFRGRSGVRLGSHYAIVAERCCFCGAEHRSGTYVRGPAVACADPTHADQASRSV